MQLFIGIERVLLSMTVTVASSAACSKLGVPVTMSRTALTEMPCPVRANCQFAPLATASPVMTFAFVVSLSVVSREARTIARIRNVAAAEGVGKSTTRPPSR